MSMWDKAKEAVRRLHFYVTDPIERLHRLDRLRARYAGFHSQVGMVFFMPRTRDRFQRQLYHRWRGLGRERDMLMRHIIEQPELKERLYPPHPKAPVASREPKIPSGYTPLSPLAPPKAIVKDQQEKPPLTNDPIAARLRAVAARPAKSKTHDRER